ncbi:MAG TPA: hypothetical protein ENN69_03315 [Spirochaetia bacterium]|nr:hypothetical protein [Spirochaetia bacterium]
MRKYKTARIRTPAVLIPYTGPILEPGAQDVFLYLRPETNGVLVESLLFRVIKQDDYAGKCRVVYLANIPGEFIIKNRIIEEHYAVKLRFARRGKTEFTRSMREKFEQFFLVPFREARIIGAFEAVRALGISDEDLFKLWVPPHHYAVISGQTVKKYNDYYIVNYDIPAILHKNSRKTDLAVMIFRSFLSRTEFHYMVEEMRRLLVAEQVVGADRPLARTFHYSNGPFEQILDGIGYLYNEHAQHLPIQSLSFCAYLLKNGIDKKEILAAIRKPIMRFRNDRGGIIEENLFYYTADETYAGALAKYVSRL